MIVRTILFVAFAGCAFAANPTCNAGWPATSFAASSIPNGGFIGNVYRAGTQITLNGTASTSGDGSGLKYFWQQLTPLATGIPQQPVSWSSHTASQPVLIGAIAGPLDIKLTVTDIGDGLSSSCIIYDGVVATDPNGGTILPTTQLGTSTQGIIGHPVSFGKNPWPYRDSATVDSLLTSAGNYDLNSVNTNNAYQHPWDNALPGTITALSCAAGSCSVTGSGTTFDVTFCGGAGHTTSTGNTYFVLWYKTGRTLVGGGAETGRMSFTDYTCSGSTGISFGIPGDFTYEGWVTATLFGGSPPSFLFPTQTFPLNYSEVFNSGTGTNPGAAWWSSGQPPYYDPVQAFYVAYYRSGIEVYLGWARTFADRLWRWPGFDMGNAFATNTQAGPAVNNVSINGLDVGGLILRAVDIQYVDTSQLSMWPGFQHYYYFAAHRNTYEIPPNPGGADPRITGGNLLIAAYGALYDTGGLTYNASTFCPNCSTQFGIGTTSWNQFNRNVIHWTMCQSSVSCHPSGYTLFKTWQDSAEGGFLNYYQGRSSYDGGQTWSGAKANVTHNSTTVTCASGSCGWLATDFNTQFTNSGPGVGAGNPCPPSADSTCSRPPIVFCAGSTLTDSSSCDTQAYCQGGCTFGSGTAFTLDRPYAGSTGAVNWIFATGTDGTVNANNGFSVAGFGQDAFMEGILANALYYASLACAGTPAGCAVGDSAQANTYFASASNWIFNYAIVASPFYGVAYHAGFPACVQGASTPVNMAYTNYVCSQSPNSSIFSREIMDDAVRGLADYYAVNGTAGYKTLLDGQYAGMWDNGTGTPPVVSPDGQYDSLFSRTGGTISTSWPYFSGFAGYYIDCPGSSGCVGNGLSQKEVSQHFGISNNDSWPITRLGGIVAPVTVTVYVGGGQIKNGTQLVVTEPTGQVDSPVTCSGNPCALSLNQSAGNYRVQVGSTGQIIVLTTQ